MSLSMHGILYHFETIFIHHFTYHIQFPASIRLTFVPFLHADFTITCSLVFCFVVLNNPIPIIFTFYQLSTRFSAPFEFCFEFVRAQSLHCLPALAYRTVPWFRHRQRDGDFDVQWRFSFKIVSMLIFCFTSFLPDSFAQTFICLTGKAVRSTAPIFLRRLKSLSWF